VNPKDHASPSSGNPNEPVRKVNAVISFHSSREIDNQVRNPNEPYMYPYQFFQNSFPSSTPETGPSSQSGDTTDGVQMLQIVLSLLSHLLRKRSFKKKTPLTWQVLHILRILPPLLLLRKFRCLCLLFPIG